MRITSRRIIDHLCQSRGSCIATVPTIALMSARAMAGAQRDVPDVAHPSIDLPEPSQIHARANFPQDLALKSPSLGDADRFADDVRRFGLASTTWEAAHCLVEYLCSSVMSSPLEFEPPSPLQPSAVALRVCDLGSGNCFLPVALAKAFDYGVSVYATDLPEVLPLMRRNAHSNLQVTPVSLAWGDVSAANRLRTLGLDLVICSDLIFFPFLYAPLLRTLLVLTTPIEGREPPAIAVGYKERSQVKETPFFPMLGKSQAVREVGPLALIQMFSRQVFYNRSRSVPAHPFRRGS